MIQTLERLSMEAWPALETVRTDGWVLRFSGGYTRRANSVHPLDPGARRLEDKIEDAEGHYRAHALAPTFKLTSASAPRDLDNALAEQGYAREATTSVRIAPLVPVGADSLRIDESWTAATEWRRAFHHMSDVPPERRALHDQMLSRISSPVAYASIGHGERVVACALGVVQEGWLGIFDVVVDRDERRRGHGERLVRGLSSWGRKIGAGRAYLQVMLSNEPALALYEKLGFSEAYPYWYRVKKTANSG